MVTSVFTPSGIAIATLSKDIFFQRVANGDDVSIEKLQIQGRNHVIVFWDKYVLVFNQLDEFSVDANLEAKLKSVMERWENSVPPIDELMSYVKKAIMDNELKIIGIMAGYCKTPDGNDVPFVYQILGDEIRRININHDGDLAYNCVYLEKDTVIGRLFREVKVQNGSQWEDIAPTKIRCDLFSLAKAKELCEFILRTYDYIENINSSMADIPTIDMALITPEKNMFETNQYA